MIFLYYCFERSRVATLYKNIRSFRNIDRDELLGDAASLDWISCWIHLSLCVGSRSLKGTTFAIDESVELGINERDAACKVWHDISNRVRGNRLWILYVRKRRYADGLIERMYGGFVSVNMDPSFHQRKLHQNLRGLGVLNAPERLQVELDVERLNNDFFTRPLLS
jgi:hypothetical protein